MSEVIKRRPSECGHHETGCFTPESNDMALIATTWSEFSARVDTISQDWVEFMGGLQLVTMLTDPEVMEMASLKWLLTTQAEFCEDLYWHATRAGEEDEEEREDLPSAQDADPEIIRDWFCWLHREIVGRVKENQLQENAKRNK